MQLRVKHFAEQNFLEYPLGLGNVGKYMLVQLRYSSSGDRVEKAEHLF